jgi:hypothetical protein
MTLIRWLLGLLARLLRSKPGGEPGHKPVPRKRKPKLPAGAVTLEDFARLWDCEPELVTRWLQMRVLRASRFENQWVVEAAEAARFARDAKAGMLRPLPPLVNNPPAGGMPPAYSGPRDPIRVRRLG